jgi:Mpv17 / PMP22 family
MVFLSHGDSRTYRLIILSLLCVMTYRVDAFFISQSPRLIRIHSDSSSSTRVAVNLQQHVHPEHQSSPDVSKHRISNTKAKPSWPHIPLLLLASLSTTMKSSNKNGNPLLFASTIVNPTSQSPLRWAIALTLILIQTYGVLFFKFFAVLLRQFSTLYMTNLVAFPCITKAISAGVIGICGDFMAQNLEHRLNKRKDNVSKLADVQGGSKFSYDVRRGLSIMTGGLFVSGPLMHLGYNLFEHILPVHGSFAALTHLVADMLILDSLFVATAFINTGIMEGYDLRRHIIPQFQRDYADTLKASWATSIMLMPLGFLCFRFLPVTLRTVAMNLTDVVWDAIISFMTHRNRHHEDRIASTTRTNSC